MRPIGRSVSAWTTKNELAFAQVQTEAKSNKTTAIPELLEQIVTKWYFISSLCADEELFACAVRSHWGIENRLHYMLDVLYCEDACRERKD